MVEIFICILHMESICGRVILLLSFNKFYIYYYYTDPCAIDETVVDLMCSLESPTHYEIQAAGLCNGLCLTATSFGKECWTVLDIDKYVHTFIY